MSEANEDIFRRAAEHYPLNTANADWDAMRKKLDAASENDDAAPTVIPAGQNRFWPLLLALLLLSLVVIDNRYTHFISGKNNSATAAKNNNPEKQETEQSLAANSTKATANNSNSLPATANQPDNAAVQQNATKDAGTTGTNENSQNNNENGKATADVRVTNNKTTNATSSTNFPADANAGKLYTAKSKSSTSIQITGATSTADKNNQSIAANNHRYSSVNANNSIVSNEKSKASHPKKRISTKQRSNMDISNGELAAEESTPQTDKTPAAKSVIVNDEKRSEKETSVDASSVAKQTPENLPAATNADSVAKKQLDTLKTIAKATSNTSSKNEKNKKEKKKHVYIGLLAGPDFSLIKLQSVYKTGLSYGAILGYNINKHFSVETGYFRDKKYYSSQGKYFNTSKLPIPAGMYIESVTGDCHMAEWPVNIYYHFSQKKKSSWFTSAGISSYFMNKEYYNFAVDYNGYAYPYAKEYKTKDNQFAAVINLSAGFNYALGKIGSLRLEPYVKLPINKVGTGDLPIQSAGILIGLTKQLF